MSAGESLRALGLIFVGIIGGALIGGPPGLFAGLLLGLILGSWMAKTDRELERAREWREQMETKLLLLRVDLDRALGRSPDDDAAVAEDEVESATEAGAQTPPPVPTPHERAAAPDAARAATGKREGDAPVRPGEVEAVRPAPAEPGPARPNPVDVAVAAVRQFFLGGNTVARVGILVLLVGIVLFLKYAADRGIFPIELRMASAGVLGMVLVFVGLHQRLKRPGFGRTLQGGGVATMYLVVFFSYRIYELLPSGLAFGLLAAIAASAAVLAVVQNAMALVVIGQAGGFLAPILASSGSDDHVVLFGYYLLLNLGIFGVAWFRAWRPLNLLGFLFTFGIGTAWGVMRYEPERFASTEPFLIAFFLLYVAIPVLFALRDQTRGWVDGSLVFGAPLVFLALQRELIGDMPFGMAYSTLGLAVLYIALARYLHTRAPESLRSMRDSFLALSIAFATMAVPYGFDNAGLTGATWALEGAGLYWLGVRQSRWLSRAAGVVLQVLASGSLALHMEGPNATLSPPVLNTGTLGTILLCLGCLFIARQAYRHREALTREWKPLQAVLISWGLGFLVVRGIVEIAEHVAIEPRPGVLVAFFGALGLTLELAGRRLAWLPGRYPAVLLFIALPLGVAVWDQALGVHLLGRGGLYGWPVWFAALALTLRRLPRDADPVFGGLHPLALWGAAAWIGLELYRALELADLGSAWSQGAAMATVAGALTVVTVRSSKPQWPFGPDRELYMGPGGTVLVWALLMLGLLFAGTANGDVSPLPYLPLVHPLDLATLFGFAAALHWFRSCRRRGHKGAGPDLMPFVPAVIATFAFLWWNAMLARSVHQMTDASFTLRELWRSSDLQVAYSVSWTLIGLGVTVFASRTARRALWMTGATLLGVVVLKLFAIDLASLGTIAKFGTFLVVGVLLLAVGYLAPVPPSKEGPEEGKDVGATPGGTP